MRRLVISAAVVLLVTGVAAQQNLPDLVLFNGKVITVDERFTIAQAVAVRGSQIVAVGTNQDINRLAGPSTRRIDLRGRSVIPGLIDNHMHLLRYGTTWKYEVRWDGVETRKEALELLRARTQTVKPGDWIYILGGWALEQFADDAKPFTRAELDRVAPNHPVFLQASYFEAFVNSRAVQLLGVDAPTGHLDENAFRAPVNKLPIAGDADIEASSLGMIADLNKSGLTAFGSAGCEDDVLQRYRQWAGQGRLNIRVFCITTPGGGNELLSRIPQMRVFNGDPFVDHVAFGENFGALSDPMFRHRETTKADDLAQWRRIVMEVAKAGLPLHVHTNFTETIDAYHRRVPTRRVNEVVRDAQSRQPAPDAGGPGHHRGAGEALFAPDRGGSRRLRKDPPAAWAGQRAGAAGHRPGGLPRDPRLRRRDRRAGGCG